MNESATAYRRAVPLAKARFLLPWSEQQRRGANAAGTDTAGACAARPPWLPARRWCASGGRPLEAPARARQAARETDTFQAQMNREGQALSKRLWPHFPSLLQQHCHQPCQVAPPKSDSAR
eukprot:1394794-Pleurochrysis_carterae.AAC.2